MPARQASHDAVRQKIVSCQICFGARKIKTIIKKEKAEALLDAKLYGVNDLIKEKKKSFCPWGPTGIVLPLGARNQTKSKNEQTTP
jgi:hypothetical protein